jgi:branched-chain amino acid transport system ATP-binding protein
MESLLGSVIGAVIISWVTFSLGSLQQYSGVAYALILILLVLFLPNGLAGLAGTDAARRVRARVAGVIGRHSRMTSPPLRQSSVELDAPVAQGSSFAATSEDGIGCATCEAYAPSSELQEDSASTVTKLLRIEDVSVLFGGLSAVNHVSLETVGGGITAIIGPNGAGKTTLFNVISGIQKPTTGHVWYENKDLSRMTSVDICRLGIARTFQNLRIFGNMSVIDNVLAGRHRHETSKFLAAGFRLPSQRREEIKSREFCLRVLGLLGLTDHAEEMAASLSYGKQRLVEIARALATEPSLLLLDEPAAGMNQSERDVLAAKILDIRASGIDILLVEHDMELIMGLSDHVGVLDHGRLICDGRPEVVQCHPAVIEAYLGAGQTIEKTPRMGHAERIATLTTEVKRGRILEVKNLSTYYGAVAAVRDVSLHADMGECVAILGANGAGKTTLLRTISGSLRSRSGHVMLQDRDITGLSAPDLVGLGMCQVLEGRHVFPTLSTGDNLMLGAGKNAKGKRFQDELHEVFELFPILSERRNQAAGSLSGGEQQMLAIGRALMGRPRILLLDEPSMGLAPLIVEAIFEALKVLNDRGITLLMVEQNATAALAIADRVVVMVTGKVVLTGTASDIKNDPRLHDLYLGRGG